MARLSIDATHKSSIKGISILEKYRRESLLLDAKYQHFIAEIIMLRLFSILENCIIETAHKIACGAKYRNGNIPVLNLLCRSRNDANHQFKTYNRVKAKGYLQWAKANYVNDSVKEIIPDTEKYRISINNHGAILNEMRKIRNHIAHRTSSTHSDYKFVISSTFGAELKIQPGAFLTSTKRLPNPKIDEYIAKTKIVINEITLG